MILTDNKVTKLRIGYTDIYLEDFDKNQGKIIVSDFDHDYNYSYYWGAMGESSISDFIKRINSDYFACKLLGAIDYSILDSKRTFAELRKHIREELDLPWYKHPEFQKDMREVLNSFQRFCYKKEEFVYNFDSHFIDSLSFYLIDDEYERKVLQSAFEDISSYSYDFLITTEGPKYHWLIDLHKKLKEELK